jgi:ATP-dependent RNA helicase RhlE
MQFSDLKLASPILRAAKNEGYVTATPIQEQAIPHVMQGRDLLGCAQTGTGKTAAFAMPILHRLSSGVAEKARRIRCLVLCPTRELASQIQDSFRTYGKELPLRHTVIFGGVSQNRQVQALRQGVDVLVATPGRLLDLLQQRLVDLRAVEVLVLDEADRMLDMGFIRDIRKIIAMLPSTRQTLLFSATMPAEIRSLAGSILRNPVTVQVATEANAGERVQDCVYFVQKQDKPALLAHLVDELPMSRAIVFTRTKHGADKVVRHLHKSGIKAEAIHGNKSQNARQRALANFSGNKIPVLVATDIASRGIDVDGLTHVVNYDLTHEPETYVHRIGRTARAGASGAAVSFCDREERGHLKAIEKLIRRSIPIKQSTLAGSPQREELPETPRVPHARRPMQPLTQPRRAPGRQMGRGIRHAAPAGRRRGR